MKTLPNKKRNCLLAITLVSIFYTGSMCAQQSTPSNLSGDFSSPYLSQALRRLRKAQNLNIAGIVLGGVHHATLATKYIIYDGNTFNNNYEEAFPVNAFGLLVGSVRLGLSPAPPIQLKKAEKAVIMMQQTPGNEDRFQQSLKNIKVAKNLATAVPILGLTAIGLVVTGYVHGGTANNGLNGFFIASWVVMGATLATTIATTVYISRARKILLTESGLLSLGVNQDGVGMKFTIGGKGR